MKKLYTLVTGASSGIGKEIAIQLSKKHNIILHGRQIDRLEKVKLLCDSSNDHLIWQQDLNSINEIESSLESFMMLNQINIEKYVHCAGFMKLSPLKLINVDLITQTFNTNVISSSLITKILTQKNNKNTLKSIVFISSNISNRGAKALSIYGASKGALDTLMRCLAIELAPNTRVNSVLPGAILTEMTQDIFSDEEVVKKIKETYPLGIGETNDIYQIVDFLLSENSKWITGQQITVDGGRSINITA
jgi:NAD(P)-dependent dehydrogenase (short-subunit alcohol dehydrogenase family)